MLYYFSYGISLGIAAGVSPGPVLALVISETLNHGLKAGMKVALALLITDIPIILLSLLAMFYFQKNNLILGILSVSGGVFLAFLARDNFRMSEFNRVNSKGNDSFRKGLIANLLNPAPYVFWLTIGTPILVRSYEGSMVDPVIFMLAFYVCLVGSKVLVAFLVNESRNFLKSGIYRWINYLLGLVLLLIAGKFVYDGYNYLFKGISA